MRSNRARLRRITAHAPRVRYPSTVNQRNARRYRRGLGGEQSCEGDCGAGSPRHPAATTVHSTAQISRIELRKTIGGCCDGSDGPGNPRGHLHPAERPKLPQLRFLRPSAPDGFIQPRFVPMQHLRTLASRSADCHNTVLAARRHPRQNPCLGIDRYSRVAGGGHMTAYGQGRTHSG